MTHHKAIAAVVGVAVIATGTIAFAERGARGDHLRPSFSELDADADGQITLEEMRARGSARFARSDTDGDGFLSEAEAVAASSARAKARYARMLERADANADGKLSLEELRPHGKRMDRMFGRVDADGSGGISAEEFADMQSRMHRHHGGKAAQTDETSD